MSGLRVLMVTQKVALDDDILGFTHTWVNRLAERVAQLHVQALSVGRHELRNNVTLYSMGKEQGAGRLRRFANFNRVVAPLVLRRRIDVVFVHMCPIYAVLAAPWAKLAGVPVVMWYSHAHVSTTLRLAHAVSTRVLTASPESYSLDGEKVRVMGHGIDTVAFRPSPVLPSRNCFRVLSVGRISPVKDYVTLIEAANVLVNEMGRNIEFRIVGSKPPKSDPSYFAELQRRVHEWGLEDHVLFVGSVPNEETPRHYREADAFASMQAMGGVGKAVLEAMASGVPTVLCTPAFNTQLDEYIDILIFRKRDARDLATKLAAVMDMDDSRHRSLAKRLRGIAEGHDVNDLMSRIVRVLEEATKRAYE